MIEFRWVTDGNGKMQLQYSEKDEVGWGSWQAIPIVTDSSAFILPSDGKGQPYRNNGTRGYLDMGQFGMKP